MIQDPPFQQRRVAAIFEKYPKRLQARLMKIRRMIFQVAEETDGVGEIEETLKWGSPSYLTSTSGSGTTIRIDRLPSARGKYGVHVHCQTNLVAPFRRAHGDFFLYDGNRGLIFDVSERVPIDELKVFITHALTYHLRKKGRH